ADEMHDVGAIESLALHHKRLLPEKLLDGRDLHRHAEDFRLQRVREPIVVDLAHAVAGAEYEVHVIAGLVCLREPVREGDLRAISAITEPIERAVEISAAQEQIEILRIAHDASILE